MRRARIKIDPAEGPARYHIYSHVVDGERRFGRREKRVIVGIVLQVADGCGIDLYTFHVSINNIHGSVGVPKKGPISDEELLRRHRVLYPNPSKYEKIRLDRIVQQLPYNTAEAIAWRKQMLALMGDISQFAKLVKQRITNWYNRTHNRFGPLWADRFGSTLTELDSRCYTRGAVRGSVEFVEGQLAKLRARVGPCPRTRVRRGQPSPTGAGWPC